MKKFTPLLCLLVTVNIALSQPQLTFQPVIPSGLSTPVDVVDPYDGTNRLFIVEKTGTIRIVTGTTVSPTPFLDVTTLTSQGGERGLLSLAFHPGYATNRYFFIYYTNTSGDITVARYRTRSDNANLAETAGTVIFNQPKAFGNHNGGDLLFGADGFLYFGTGDGGGTGDPGNNAQNGSSLLGKMLRIDVNGFATSAPFYAIPPTNPYTTNPGVADEIIALGLRNPFRWSFDRSTGDMWVADVGQDLWEEVNIRTSASLLTPTNYGWDCYEGNQQYTAGCTTPADNVFPIFVYPHNNTTGGFSITGGLVYRGSDIPTLQGYYLTSDHISGNGWLIKQNGSSYDVTMYAFPAWPKQLTSFMEAQDGKLYATGLNGVLYRIVLSGTLPLHLVSFNGRSTNNYHELTWQVKDEEAGDIYVVETRTFPTSSFVEIYRTSALSGNLTNSYLTRINVASSAYYRLKIISRSGQVQYSPVVFLRNDDKNQLSATVIANQLYLTTPKEARSITLHDASGRLLLRKQITNMGGATTIPLNGISRGAIIITIDVPGGRERMKVVY